MSFLFSGSSNRYFVLRFSENRSQFIFMLPQNLKTYQIIRYIRLNFDCISKKGRKSQLLFENKFNWVSSDNISLHDNTSFVSWVFLAFNLEVFRNRMSTISLLTFANEHFTSFHPCHNVSFLCVMALRTGKKFEFQRKSQVLAMIPNETSTNYIIFPSVCEIKQVFLIRIIYLHKIDIIRNTSRSRVKIVASI